MKKLIIVIFCVFALGCSKNENIKVKPTNTSIKEKEVYEDKNTMPISFYKIKSYGVLEKVTSKNSSFEELKDIDIFQIYPSNEDSIKLTNGFGEDFYNKWNELDKEKNHKIGFNVKFKTYNKEEISYNIFNPDNAMKEYNYLLIYLYDDYTNRNKSWYSHIEQEELNNYPYITSIKLTGNNKIGDIISDITLTVFTYDSTDDFDTYGEYRGKSKYSITIHSVDYEE